MKNYEIAYHNYAEAKRAHQVRAPKCVLKQGTINS